MGSQESQIDEQHICFTMSESKTSISTKVYDHLVLMFKLF